MRRLFAQTLRQATRPYLDRGRLAFVRGGTIAALVLVGGGFVLASAVMGLASLVGQIAASGLVGVALLAAAALIALRPRPIVLIEPVEEPDPVPNEMALAEVSFALGFVLIRALLRRRKR